MQIAILTVKQLEAIVNPGRLSDGNGTYLKVDKAGGKRWLYRYQLNGKRTTHGLGGYHPKTNSLAVARSEAIECKALVNKSVHPGKLLQSNETLNEHCQETYSITLVS